MINGLRKELSLYKGINKHLDTAIDYINNEDLNKLEVGPNVIDDHVVITKLIYKGKDESVAQAEEHRHHLDMQVLLSGREICYFDYLKEEDEDHVLVPYHEVKDVVKYDKVLRHKLVFDNENFTLFFPSDVHKPGIKIDDEDIVKLVVKVLID